MPSVRRDQRVAMRFIFLMGLVSLLADMTYEGGHSITGPFLSILGAGPAAIGLVSGLGEFVGYALRLLSGYLADRTRQYWPMTILGYGLNLVAVPLLGLVGRWEVAAGLVVAERLGKALRTPARDVMLSYATRRVGTGWGFGLHELMDQIGAVTGPLLVASVLYFRAAAYRAAFLTLLAPAGAALAVLLLSRALYPDPRGLEPEAATDGDNRAERRVPTVLWFYLLFTGFSIAGYAHFQLVSYHFKVQAVVPEAQIPLLFALAMGVDALVALPVGRLFDRRGLATLVLLPLFTLPVPFLVFSSSYALVLPGVVLWGAAMGVQETVMRAALAEIVPPERRGLAYGLFNAVYGLSWFLGSTALGVAYGLGAPYVMLLAGALEVLSLPFLYLLSSSLRRE
ncbi:MAG: MFS transporter [Clostridia bacterium]|jgi:MFS family permease|nr:MFS transporter [Clostridia bacterium]MDH7572461.1 MFS transporter [Clostridia bacterium]